MLSSGLFSSASPPTRLHQRMKYGFKKVELTWAMNDFAMHVAVAKLGGLDRLTSDAFTIARPSGCAVDLALEVQWTTKREVDGQERQKEEEEHLGFFVHLKNPRSLLVMGLTLVIQDSKGKAWKTMGPHTRVFGGGHGCRWGYPNLMKRSALEEVRVNRKLFLSDGTFTIAWTMEVPCKDLAASTRPKMRAERHLTLGEHLYVKSAAEGDVTVVSTASDFMSGSREKRQQQQKKKFKVHKSVLTCRSEVFMAMFAHQDTSESLTKVIFIEDISPKGVEDMLTFLYTDDCEALRTGRDLAAIRELLKAGDKYNVAALKHRCERRLSDLTCVASVAEVARIAGQYNADSLTDFVVQFVADNFDAVLASKWWKDTPPAVAQSPGRCY